MLKEMEMSEHLIDGEFQSDKYPTTPRGKVPLSCKDVTPDPKALADAIDPRMPHPSQPGRVGSWSAVYDADLIAAADYIRTQASPPADVMEVVTRLCVSDAELKLGQIRPLLNEAAAILLSLSASMQEAQDRAFEKAAGPAEKEG
jgi:hypothetical protein